MFIAGPLFKMAKTQNEGTTEFKQLSEKYFVYSESQLIQFKVLAVY
jgi:hypothetical protein